MMRHKEARELLVDWARKRLNDTIEAAVAAHVDQCRTCGDWLETYSLLAGWEEAPGFATEAHPESDLLALWAARPEEVDEPARSSLLAHLGGCEGCRRESDVVRRAVVNGRPAVVPPASDNGRSPRSQLARTLIAATLATIGIGVASLVPSLVRNPEGSRRTAVRVTAPEDSPSQYLADVEIGGDRSIEASDTLTVINVKIAGGARVDLRAGRQIALGNGFEIASGARATIGTTPQNDSGGSDP